MRYMTQIKQIKTGRNIPGDALVDSPFCRTSGLKISVRQYFVI